MVGVGRESSSSTSHDEMGITATIVNNGTSQAAKLRLGEIAQLVTSTDTSCCWAVTVAASEVDRGSKDKDGVIRQDRKC